MLDSIHIQNPTRTTYVDRNINVSEYRAPTDKSVELLNEFQKEARNNLIRSFPLENNLFRATVHLFRLHLEASVGVTVIYQINYSTQETKFTVRDWEIEDSFKLTEMINKRVARDIASLINLSHLHIPSLKPSQAKSGISYQQDKYSVSYGHCGIDNIFDDDISASDVKFETIKHWLSYDRNLKE